MPRSLHDPAHLLDGLREGTRAEHEAIERTLAELTSSSLTRERYRFRLGQLYGFYRPVEAQLARVLQGGPVDLRARAKVPLLRADLEVLGWASVDALPLCTTLPALDDEAACFGCLYVLEGSTLGGQVIRKHVQACLGVTPERGARFFAGYGRASGAMWSAFRAALVEHATRSGRADAILSAALETFVTLRAWCEHTPVLERRVGRDG